MPQEITVNGRHLFTMPDVITPTIPDREFRITDFGAVGDGLTMNTEAINAAIEACSQAGGGKVVIPAGLWLTGPIQLKSRINLYTEKGALVTFSDKFEDYPLVTTFWEGNEWVRCMSPITGENLEHVAITGHGVFDGNGGAWRPIKNWKMTARQWDAIVKNGGVVDHKGVWWPEENAMNGAKLVGELRKNPDTKLEDYLPFRSFLRPVLMSLRNCKYVLLDGPVFQNSAAWNLHPWCCEHFTMRNVTVRNPWFSQNGDGLDLESCRYSIIEDCMFDVGDDAICMKSGKNAEGRALGRPVEYVIVRNCVVYHGHGGFVIGSEMSGGARNMLVTDCTFIGTDVGLRFKSTRGRGGTVENIAISGVRMKEITGSAITFNMYYALKGADAVLMPVTEETPVFRNFYIEDTSCAGAGQAIELRGLPEMPIEDIELVRVKISARTGVDCTDAVNIRFNDVTILTEEGPGWSVTNGRDISLTDCSVKGGEGELLKVSGERSANVTADAGSKVLA